MGPTSDAPRVFADAASGQPLNPAARQALMAAVDAGWADPARLYREGRQASLLLDAARESIAATVGLRPPEVSFTGSGVQALHLAVQGAVQGAVRGAVRGAVPGALSAPGVVVSAVEHSAILRAADEVEARGAPVTTLGVDARGRVSPDDVASALRGADRPRLVAVQWANHEVGTIQPLEEVHEACRAAGVPLLVDATQGLGRLPWAGTADLVAADARMWGGPPGIGILGIRPGTGWVPPGPVDERESGRVPGFSAVPLAVAAARGLEWAEQARASESARARSAIERLRAIVVEGIPDVVILGDDDHRLPHLLAMSCLYVSGDALVLEMDRAGFAVTSGSSCVADTRRPSHVLAAMGALTQGNVRISLPYGFADDDIPRLGAALVRVVSGIRADLGAPA